MTNHYKDALFYKRIFFIEDADLAAVQNAGRQIHDQYPQFYEHLYAWMQQHPSFSQDYNAEVVEAVRGNELVFWEDMVLGELTDDHVERQRFLGLIFSEVGFSFDACSAFLNYYHHSIDQLLQEHQLDDKHTIRAFNKITALIVAAITDGYNEANNRVLRQQNEALMEMSTPISELWAGILLLPLVGYIDSKRASTLMTAVLTQIAERSAKAFILDISGIAAMDTAVSNYLIKITKAAQLMGCKCFISGISGAVAQTIVELGVEINEISTTGTMLDALRKALQLTGRHVSE